MRSGFFASSLGQAECALGSGTEALGGRAAAASKLERKTSNDSSDQKVWERRALAARAVAAPRLQLSICRGCGQ